MAVPTIESSTYQYQASPTNNPSINLPASVSAGELLVALVHTASSGNATSMSGWTQLLQSAHSSGRVSIFAKDASGSEGGTTAVVTVTSPSSLGSFVMSISGADVAASADHVAARETLGTGSTSYAHQSITVAVGDSLLLRGHTRSGSTGPSTPAGWTLLQAITHGGPVTTYFTKDGGAASGATGTQTFSGVADWPTHGGVALAIAPSAATAPTITSATITGTSQVGQTLTAVVVTDQDPVDSTAYQWEKASDGSGTGAADISGATSSTLALTYAELGSLLDAGDAYVRFGAIATKNSLPSDEDFSAWQQVTIPSGGGLVSSPLKSPFLIA